MRQVVAFRAAINKRITIRTHSELSVHAKLHNAELKPLDEILGVGCEERPFDEKTDAELERRALRNLEQRKKLANV